jgi:hypothetical protein
MRYIFSALIELVLSDGAQEELNSLELPVEGRVGTL